MAAHVTACLTHLNVQRWFELYDVPVERFSLLPADLCEMRVQVHNADVVEALPMAHKVHRLQASRISVSMRPSLSKHQHTVAALMCTVELQDGGGGGGGGGACTIFSRK